MQKERFTWKFKQAVKALREVLGSRVARVLQKYKMGNIERAFRNLKTVTLEMRPVHHKLDARIVLPSTPLSSLATRRTRFRRFSGCRACPNRQPLNFCGFFAKIVD